VKLPRPMVILFGAGATRAAFAKKTLPPPLDADFFDIAGQITGRGTRRLAQKVRRDVFDLYGKVTGIGLEQYYRDIETRLELGKFAKSKNRPKDWQVRTKNLEELVRRVLIHTTCELDEGSAKPSCSQIHEVLLRRVKAGDTLVTFNYDTVIEESMPENISLWTPRDGYGVGASGITRGWAKKWLMKHSINNTKSTQIRLLKLHGSLNWVLYKTSKVRLKPRPYVVRSKNGKAMFDKAAILPPGWHKRVDRNPYNALWRQARLEIEKCATLVIIGYSLPDTDLIARALFLEASRSLRAGGRFIKELHVADISDSTKNRIVDLFVPALGPEGVVFRYGGAQELVAAWAPNTAGT
jgi:hypothetical protein